MNRSLRVACLVVLLGAACATATARPAAAQGTPQEATAGRIVDMEPHHGYVVVEFPNGRMNVAMDKREMGQYAIGDEILIDSFGRPLPRRPPPPRPHR